jgi:hypothetical protein
MAVLSVVNLLENYPIALQLWASQPKNPGAELDLSNALNRNLSIDIMDGNLVAHTASENDANSIVTIDRAERGVFSIRLDAIAWGKLKPNTKYMVRVKAYGATWSMEPIQIGAPSPGITSLNGVKLYCAPSNILETLGTIPGAIAQTMTDLSARWSTNTNPQGYWTLTLNADERLWDLWVDRLHVTQVDYADLATGATRAWAKVANTIYYKGPERIGDVPVESAFSMMVRDQIRYATEEIEEGTGRHFGLRRAFREVQNGMYSDRQIFTREYPAIVDEWFRIDAYGMGRNITRRFTEADVSNYPGQEGRDRLHVDGETGGISVNDALFDFGDDFSGDAWFGGGKIPQGRNNVEITYTFGSAKLPGLVQEAAAKLAAIRLLNYWERSMAQGLEGPSLGCVNIKFADSKSYYDRWKSDAHEAIEHFRSHHTDFL